MNPGDFEMLRTHIRKLTDKYFLGRTFTPEQSRKLMEWARLVVIPAATVPFEDATVVNEASDSAGEEAVDRKAVDHDTVLHKEVLRLFSSMTRLNYETKQKAQEVFENQKELDQLGIVLHQLDPTHRIRDMISVRYPKDGGWFIGWKR